MNLTGKEISTLNSTEFDNFRENVRKIIGEDGWNVISDFIHALSVFGTDEGQVFLNLLSQAISEDSGEAGKLIQDIDWEKFLKIVQERNPDACVNPLFFTYLQGEALNNLMIASTKLLQPDIMGNAVVNVSDRFRLKINDFSTLKGGVIPPSALQLFDCFIIAFTHAPTKTAKIRLPLKTYMEWRGLSDPKAARKQVLDGIKVLKRIEFSAKEKVKGKWVDSGYVAIWGGTGYIRNNIIFFNFNADFHGILSRYKPMDYLKDKLKINTKQFPHAYYFSHWIDLNYRMNEQKPRVNTISVKTLLSKAPLLPTYSEISQTTRQYYKRIIKPVIDNLDAIDHLYYDFIDEDNNIIDDPLNAFKGTGGYSFFESCRIRIDYSDYPKHTKRIAAQEKHKKDFEKEKTKAAAKIAAKAEAEKSAK